MGRRRVFGFFVLNNVMWFRINSKVEKGFPLGLKATVAPPHVVFFSQLLYIYNRAHRNWLLWMAPLVRSSLLAWPLGSARPPGTTPVYVCFLGRKKNEQKALRFGELAVASVARRSEPTAAIAQDLDYIYISIVISIIIYRPHLNRIYGTRLRFSPFFVGFPLVLTSDP